MHFYWKNRHLWWIIPLLAADTLFAVWLIKYRKDGHSQTIVDEALEEPRHDPLQQLHFPTDQIIDRNDPSVFQATASGRLESAFYGSTRSAINASGRLRASFHEGIDIAVLRRDASGLPQDAVYAVADGVASYINPIAGNSGYGKYIVVTHDCPAGMVYTLYAHLAKITSELYAGKHVKAGETLGIIGTTASYPIPTANAHLHFEIGLILNRRFAAWFKAQRLKGGHGMFNGWNLIGIDPLAVFEAQQSEIDFDFFRHVRAIPAAFELLVRIARLPNYFEHYPSFWTGECAHKSVIWLQVSENGLPLAGRPATPVELAKLGNRRYDVLRVDNNALGRNGRRLVVCQNGRWRLGRNGEQWLDILLH